MSSVGAGSNDKKRHAAREAVMGLYRNTVSLTDKINGDRFDEAQQLIETMEHQLAAAKRAMCEHRVFSGGLCFKCKASYAEAKL